MLRILAIALLLAGIAVSWDGGMGTVLCMWDRFSSLWSEGRIVADAQAVPSDAMRDDIGLTGPPGGEVVHSPAPNARAGPSPPPPAGVNSVHPGGTAATTAPPPVEPQSLLESAIRMFDTRNSVSAKIRHRIDLFGKQLVGDGEYLEQRRNGAPAIRLELKIQLGEKTNTFLQVCDGQYFWVYRKFFGKESLSRIDAARVAGALSEVQNAADPAAANTLPALGGLPRLLRGLNANFQFTSAEQGQWRDLQVWKLEGGWKHARLARILPKQKEAIALGKPFDLSRLPEPLPDRVVLLLGQEDLFPYRVEYCRTVTKKDGEVEVAETRSLLTMELFEVNLNLPLDPGRFTYSPGSVDYADRTEAFLQGLGVKRK